MLMVPKNDHLTCCTYLCYSQDFCQTLEPPGLLLENSFMSGGDAWPPGQCSAVPPSQISPVPQPLGKVSWAEQGMVTAVSHSLAVPGIQCGAQARVRVLPSSAGPRTMQRQLCERAKGGITHCVSSCKENYSPPALLQMPIYACCCRAAFLGFGGLAHEMGWGEEAGP